jgi:hypothetical protein
VDETDAETGGRKRGDSGGRPRDDRSAGGFRGPLVFGVIAATVEFAIILALIYC